MQHRTLLLLVVVLASALLLRAEAPARSTLKPRHESEMAVETEMDEPIIPTFDDTDAMTAEEEPAQTDADSDKRSYMRFGRSYMRFGRSAVSARFSDNAVPDAVEADKRSAMAPNARDAAMSNSKRSYMRFGKRSYMRFGK